MVGLKRRGVSKNAPTLVVLNLYSSACVFLSATYKRRVTKETILIMASDSP